MDLRFQEILQRLGYSSASCARLVKGVTELPKSQLAVQRLRDQVCECGFTKAGDAFERAFLAFAAQETIPDIETLPVYEPVKSLMRAEFEYYTRPPKPGSDPIAIGTYAFVVACKTIALSRFPAGPLDWEISGFPRSWFLKIRPRDLPRVLTFLLYRVRGLAPLFFIHVARSPKKRSLVIEKEVLRSYYRIARSLELQPKLKGILASAWFHDPAAVEHYPHLEWLNRPYLDANGLIVMGAPAPADSGFMDRNEKRKEQYLKGEIRFRMGIALWPRAAAIRWSNDHPEFAG